MRDFFWPKNVVERPRGAGDDDDYLRSYMILRALVGAIAFLLPVLLVLLECRLFHGRPCVRASLSAYYYTGTRELFVGALCAIGIFLIAYRVAERARENRASTYAGIAIVVVALFPTKRPGAGIPLTPLQDRFHEKPVHVIHFVAAAVAISLLALISYYFSKPSRHPRHGRLPRSFWRGYHLVCAGVTAASGILAGATGLLDWPPKGILVGEWGAVWAFAFSWFAKGAEFDILRSTRRRPNR